MEVPTQRRPMPDWQHLDQKRVLKGRGQEYPSLDSTRTTSTIDPAERLGLGRGVLPKKTRRLAWEPFIREE